MWRWPPWANPAKSFSFVAAAAYVDWTSWQHLAGTQAALPLTSLFPTSAASRPIQTPAAGSSAVPLESASLHGAWRPTCLLSVLALCCSQPVERLPDPKDIQQCMSQHCLELEPTAPAEEQHMQCIHDNLNIPPQYTKAVQTAIMQANLGTLVYSSTYSGSLKKTFGNKWHRSFYRLHAFTVTNCASKHWTKYLYLNPCLIVFLRVLPQGQEVEDIINSEVHQTDMRHQSTSCHHWYNTAPDRRGHDHNYTARTW